MKPQAIAQLVYDYVPEWRDNPLPVAVALGESDGDETAYYQNPTTHDASVGLWQINYHGDMKYERTYRYGPPASLVDPLKNLRAAHEIWLDAGRSWSPWGAFTDGGYRRFGRYETAQRAAAAVNRRDMTTAAESLRQAVSELGYTEYPPGSNRQKFSLETGLENGVYWCAIFVSAILKRCGVPHPDTASVAVMEQFFRNAHRWDELPSAGDVVTFDWHDGGIETDHIAFVEDASGWANHGTVVTIEGNTSSTNEGSQSNGGGVFRRVRPRSVIRGFGHPQYEEEWILAALTEAEQREILDAARVINTEVKRVPGSETIYQAVTSQHADGKAYDALDEIKAAIRALDEKVSK